MYRFCSLWTREVGEYSDRLLGAAMAAAWFNKFPPFEVRLKLAAYGILLGLAPLLCVLGHWRVINFKRDVAWVSMTDNKLYRAIADMWNRFLERLVISKKSTS